MKGPNRWAPTYVSLAEHLNAPGRTYGIVSSKATYINSVMTLIFSGLLINSNTVDLFHHYL